jgi:hypothetical protein
MHMRKKPMLDTEWNRRSFAVKFWNLIDVRGEHECWPWQGGLNPSGYGELSCPLVTFGGNQRAHRVSYFLIKGNPGDLDVCHECDNRPCCNPAHLFLCAHIDNMRHMVVKGRASFAKLSPTQALDIWNQLQTGGDPTLLAREFGATRSMITRIASGETWSSVTQGFTLQHAEQPPRPQPPQPPLPTLPPLPAMRSALAPIETIDDHPIIRVIMSRKNTSDMGGRAPVILQPVAGLGANILPMSVTPIGSDV